MQKKLYRQCKLNDYLIINDLYFPIQGNQFRHIDSLIFGNKYIYVVKQIKQLGEIKVEVNDAKWRVIDGKSMMTIDNPLIENRKRIARLLTVANSLNASDFKSIAMFSKTCKFSPINNQNYEFVLREDDVVLAINEIEKNSNDDIFDPKEVEKYARAFFEEGKKAEEEIKRMKNDE